MNHQEKIEKAVSEIIIHFERCSDLLYGEKDREEIKNILSVFSPPPDEQRDLILDEAAKVAESLNTEQDVRPGATIAAAAIRSLKSHQPSGEE